MCIAQSVGRSSPNQSTDVLIAQALLNLNLHRLPGIPFLQEDGSYGPRTQAAIDAFQKLILPPDRRTGSMRPGGTTIRRLREAITPHLTVTVLEVLMPLGTLFAADRFLDPLASTMDRFDISTPLRRAHFLAQVGHESGSLKFTEEIASGEDYEGRADLGNTEPGDGVRFKGRGLIQLTGRANYTAIGGDLGRDFVTAENHKLLASDPALAALCAGWFWTKNRLNELADQDDVERVTRRINGGLNGIEDRTRRLALCKCILQVA